MKPSQSSNVTSRKPQSPRSPRQPAKKRQKRASPTESEIEEAYENTTDPLLVTHPVERLVHESLSESWKVTRGNQMCFIFDAHSPARQFKRGVPFRQNAEYPIYGKPPYDNLTETDEDEPGLMPFSPCNYK